MFQGHPFPADFTDAARRPSGRYVEAAGISGVHSQTGKFEQSEEGHS